MAMIRVTKATTEVTSSALRGSPPAVVRLRKPLAGSTRCWASASMTRGAATSEPSADEKVAPSMPARMVHPQSALSTISVLLLSSSAGVATRASQYARSDIDNQPGGNGGHGTDGDAAPRIPQRPLMLMPAMMPVTAGKKMAKVCQKSRLCEVADQRRFVDEARRRRRWETAQKPR